MNIKDLKYFQTVCEKASITAAAESLYITPQALSKIMQKLEREVSANLFIRSSNGVAVTSYGQILYASASKILDTYDAMLIEVERLKSHDSGMLKIASAFGILRYLTPDFINVFSDKNPNARLDYMEFPDQYVYTHILDESYDFGLVPYIQKEASFEYMDLFALEIFFITNTASKFYNYPEVSVKEIVEEPLVIENENFIIQHGFIDTCKRECVKPQIYFHSSGYSMCYKLCNAGKGNTISPQYIYDDMDVKHALKRIPFREHPQWKVALIYKKGSACTSAMNAFIRFIKNWKIAENEVEV